MDPTYTGTTQITTRTRPGAGVSCSDRPRLARHVRLTFCRTRQRQVLLHPETVVILNGSGADILELCDGRHTVAEIVTELGARYQNVPDDEVRQFLTRLVARRWVELAHG
ncbi:pyrroloquinoline quinone biosynthesis peptide chaperone PqqD [Streptomyces sp. NPDC059837]|jgi:pyrroloquinoline quinone biosynthesis protein D|uniref:pyrroloquinoline quinone biosynthesis peptide chaperone PqqD n=1 Tax=unclassified Streptomyces TaxID=2593676 RepID=UPI002257DDA2|nr:MULTISPECIES: pyrroloquinoline quinone biosynthesis peptide chaperone PqqD [unclassified Streptomyces]MCX4410203.1 pyrroloquinoline quinone biosynthesis peptide chaperone PqqD [Streptomyces sp. NBC_01764]MCX5191979.1 pyrroloquinoline quinone biosynthesis peptide chaperone PqqD [Streptomyces sp. NBC_00268]